MNRPMPEVLLDYFQDDLSDIRKDRVRVRGCVWPREAWEKAQRVSMRAVRLLDDVDLTPAIGVVRPPEVIGVTFQTSGRARGRRGDWEIVFEGPDGRRGRLSDIIASVRGRVVGEFFDDVTEVWALARANRLQPE